VATAALARLVSVAWHTNPIVTTVAGIPSDTEPAYRLSNNTTRTKLGDLASRALVATARHRIVLSWAASRSHASSTEMLAGLADDGLLTPNRENRKGRGLHYRPMPG
jgi:hypothetical protein